MKLFKQMILVILMLSIAVSAHAVEWTPFQLSFFNPVQLFPEETKVQGVRINLLYGVNKELDGIDYGLVNRTKGTTNGVQVGAFPFGGVNITENLNGVQIGGVIAGANLASGEDKGFQLAGIAGGVNSAGNMDGIQLAGIWAGVNMADNLNGIQISGVFVGVNIAKDAKGLQIGTIYNQANAMEGLQFGLVNVCNKMKGIQIGLVNVIKESKLPFFPIVNASF